MSFYEINEPDIAKVLNYMRIFHPEKANREYVVNLLTAFKSGLRNISRKNPDDIEALYEAYEASLNESEGQNV